MINDLSVCAATFLFFAATSSILFFAATSSIATEELAMDNNMILGNTVEPIGDDSFTIVALPDTQHYVQKDKYSENLECFESQIQWIIENKEKLNIVFVSHVGDIVESYGTEESEFIRASNVMRKLDKVVPYGFCIGNHDMKSDGTADIFNEYFPASRYAKYDWWAGSFSGNRNNCQIFSAGGDDYLALHLEFCPTDEALQWANEMLARYPGRRAFITTHSYVTPVKDGIDGIATRDSRLSGNQPGMHHMGDNAGIDIMEKVIIPNEKVFMVLCGHYHGERLIVSELDGRKVYGMLSDYGFEPHGGDGWLRVLQFVPSENRIYVRIYSPYLKQFRASIDSHSILDYPMTK